MLLLSRKIESVPGRVIAYPQLQNGSSLRETEDLRKKVLKKWQEGWWRYKNALKILSLWINGKAKVFPRTLTDRIGFSRELWRITLVAGLWNTKRDVTASVIHGPPVVGNSIMWPNGASLWPRWWRHNSWITVGWEIWIASGPAYCTKH